MGLTVSTVSRLFYMPRIQNPLIQRLQPPTQIIRLRQLHMRWERRTFLNGRRKQRQNARDLMACRAYAVDNLTEVVEPRSPTLMRGIREQSPFILAPRLRRITHQREIVHDVRSSECNRVVGLPRKLATDRELPFLPVCVLFQGWKEQQQLAKDLVPHFLELAAWAGSVLHVAFRVVHSRADCRMHNRVVVGQ